MLLAGNWVSHAKGDEAARACCHSLVDLYMDLTMIWKVSRCLQEAGQVTLRVMSRPGRISQAGHIMTIVRNLLGEEASGRVGRIRLLKEHGEEVCSTA